MGVVTKKSDAWIEVPAEIDGGMSQGPLQLRPGADETKVRLKAVGAFEQEVSIADLREGISLVDAEHSR
jgi:hypothetical protein